MIKKNLLAFQPNSRLQVAWYLVLILIAVGAVLKSIFLPPWPKAPELSSELVLEALEFAGFSPKSRDSLLSFRSYDLSTSPILVFTLTNGFELRVLVAVTRERAGFTIEKLFESNDAVALVDSRFLVDSPVPTLTGFINQRPAFQTCQFRSSNSVPTYEVAANQLPLLIDDYDGKNINRFNQIIGLQQSRTYRCTLITLVSPNQLPIPMRVWTKLLAATSTAFLP